MKANDFQKEVMRTANTDLSDESALTNAAMGLAGETGEYVDLLKKWLFHGHDLDLNKAKKELGDIAFYLAWASECHGFTLESVFETVINKLKLRYPNGFNSEDSKLRRDINTEHEKTTT